MKVFYKNRILKNMGKVTDTLFICCYWPGLDIPTKIFTDDSSGLKVMGSPTPRNVVFPDGTQFLDYYPDALFPTDNEVLMLNPSLKNLINLSEALSTQWFNIYTTLSSSLPATASIFRTTSECFFIKHRDPDDDKKVYVSELTLLETADLVATPSKLTQYLGAKTFIEISAFKDDPATKEYTLDQNLKPVEVIV